MRALGAAGDFGDYALVMEVVKATAGYGAALSKQYRFGEGGGTVGTEASVSKLRKIWNLFLSLVVVEGGGGGGVADDGLPRRSVRGKFRAALNLYRRHSAVDPSTTEKQKQKKKKDRPSSITMEGDNYTTSILFTILAESIDRDDGGDCFFDNTTTEKGDGAGKEGSSPCVLQDQKWTLHFE